MKSLTVNTLAGRVFRLCHSSSKSLPLVIILLTLVAPSASAKSRRPNLKRDDPPETAISRHYRPRTSPDQSPLDLSTSFQIPDASDPRYRGDEYAGITDHHEPSLMMDHEGIPYEEALRRMAENYPSVDSYQAKIDAAKERALAKWLGYAPEIRARFGAYSGNIKFSFLPQTYSGQGREHFYGLAMTLFDGGTLFFSAQGLEKEQKVAEYEALQNINDLAVQATQAYAGVIIAKRYRKLLDSLIDVSTELKRYVDNKIKVPEEFHKQLMTTRNIYESKKVNADQTIAEQQNLLELVVVKIDKVEVENLTPLEKLSENIKIPKNIDEALTHLDETIKVNIAEYKLQSASKNYQAAMANAISPNVTLTVGQSYDSIHLREPNQNFLSESQMATVTINWTGSVANIPTVRAAANDRSAAYFTKETTLREVRFALQGSYIQLRGRIDTFKQKEALLFEQIKNLNENKKQMASNSLHDIQSALNMIIQFEDVWTQYTANLASLILSKAQIAATLGLYSKYSKVNNTEN